MPCHTMGLPLSSTMSFPCVCQYAACASNTQPKMVNEAVASVKRARGKMPGEILRTPSACVMLQPTTFTHAPNLRALFIVLTTIDLEACPSLDNLPCPENRCQ